MTCLLCASGMPGSWHSLGACRGRRLGTAKGGAATSCSSLMTLPWSVSLDRMWKRRLSRRNSGDCLQHDKVACVEFLQSWQEPPCWADFPACTVAAHCLGKAFGESTYPSNGLSPLPPGHRSPHKLGQGNGDMKHVRLLSVVFEKAGTMGAASTWHSLARAGGEEAGTLQLSEHKERSTRLILMWLMHPQEEFPTLGSEPKATAGKSCSQHRRCVPSPHENDCCTRGAGTPGLGHCLWDWCLSRTDLFLADM